MRVSYPVPGTPWPFLRLLSSLFWGVRDVRQQLLAEPLWWVKHRSQGVGGPREVLALEHSLVSGTDADLCVVGKKAPSVQGGEKCCRSK